MSPDRQFIYACLLHFESRSGRLVDERVIVHTPLEDVIIACYKLRSNIARVFGSEMTAIGARSRSAFLSMRLCIIQTSSLLLKSLFSCNCGLFCEASRHEWHQPCLFKHLPNEAIWRASEAKSVLPFVSSALDYNERGNLLQTRNIEGCDEFSCICLHCIR